MSLKKISCLKEKSILGELWKIKVVFTVKIACQHIDFCRTELELRFPLDILTLHLNILAIVLILWNAKPINNISCYVNSFKSQDNLPQCWLYEGELPVKVSSGNSNYYVANLWIEEPRLFFEGELGVNSEVGSKRVSGGAHY